MQVMIELPDGYMEKLPEIMNGSIACNVVLDSVKNGTPLPKGHGRLVDGDCLWNRMSCYSDDEGAGVDYANDDVNPIILRDSAMEVIENAPTIIPADKESEET